MPRASRRTETPPQQHLVPDVLAPGLDLVFCGTAPSPISFKRRAYYANPGNSFWSTLHRVGLLPQRFEPERYAEVLGHGIGLTDLNKTEYGSDHELTPEALDAAAVRAKLRTYKPAAVAFTSKNAGGLFFGVRDIGYGRQSDALVATLDTALRDIAYFVLASPSGRARSWWRVEPWQEVAAFVEARRRARA